MKLFTMTMQATALTALISTAAVAEPVITVTLIDKVGSSDTQVPEMGMGMGKDMSMAKMGINASPRQVRPGPVTFKVTNLASKIVHEVIVARLPGGTTTLPYDEATMMVKENALQAFGSVNEIDPSRSAALTLTMKPGKYILYCNLPGHYMAGMWTVIDVAP
jgi:uncharacterized cupredoxin-like copper-binding protein